MTLILPRTDLAKDFITGGQNNVGIRVPEHTVALALLKGFEAQGGLGIAAPSANRFGKVSPTTSEAVEEELGSFLLENDQILDGGQSKIGIESTIIDCTRNLPVILRPGYITTEMIEKVLNIKTIQINLSKNLIKAPGLLAAHYSPNAHVILDKVPKPGDGFIALEHIPTPIGAIRLASPRDNYEYAQILYSALRLADSKGIKTISAVTPEDQGLGLAVNDRLFKASNTE
jgi:L-threonylcarbamoyladenylate synthase